MASQRGMPAAAPRDMHEQLAQEETCTTEVEQDPASATPAGRPRRCPVVVLAASAAGLGFAATVALNPGALFSKVASDPAVVSGAQAQSGTYTKFNCPDGGPWVQLGTFGDDVPGWGISPQGNSADSIEKCASSCEQNNSCVAFEYRDGFDWDSQDGSGSAIIRVCVQNDAAHATEAAQTTKHGPRDPDAGDPDNLLVTCTRGCSVTDGSAASQYYPCKCGSSEVECSEGQLCDWNTTTCTPPPTPVPTPAPPTSAPTPAPSAPAPPPASPMQSPPETEPSGWQRIAGTGCEDWRTIALMDAYPTTLEDCKIDCLKHRMCASINYQSGPSSICGLGSIEPGYCYLFAGAADGTYKCNHEPNPCWDLLIRPPSGAPVGVGDGRKRKGCRNADAIKIGEGYKAFSKYACAEKCYDTQGCAAIVHQPGQCGGAYKEEDINWCILLRAGCDEELVTCRDLYYMNPFQANYQGSPSDNQGALAPAYQQDCSKCNCSNCQGGR